VAGEAFGGGAAAQTWESARALRVSSYKGSIPQLFQKGKCLSTKKLRNEGKFGLCARKNRVEKWTDEEGRTKVEGSGNGGRAQRQLQLTHCCVRIKGNFRPESWPGS
jgi:hypothetical protein